jgi:hypothetical protein
VPVFVVALVVVSSAVLIPVAIRWPARTILPAYAATLPIGSIVKLDVPVPAPFDTLSSLLGGLFIFCGLIHLALLRDGRVPSAPVGAWLLLLGWLSVTTFWAVNTQVALSTLMLAVPLIGFLVVASLSPIDDVDVDSMRLAIICSGLAVGAYGIVLLGTGHALPLHGVSERFSLVTNPDQANPNILAASLLLPLALSLERMIFGGRRWLKPWAWRLLGGFGVFFTLDALVLTSSRGGMVAAFVVVVAGLYFCGRVPGARRIVLRAAATIAVTSTVLVAAAFLSVTLSPQGLVVDILQSGPIQRIVSRQADSSGRLEIWAAGRLACASHCALGAGAGNFPQVYNEVQAFTGADKNVGPNRPAHNVYIEIAVETGVVGFSLFALALLMEWSALSRPEIVAISPIMRAALLGLLVASIFLSAIWFKYFWLVFVLIRAAEGVQERTEARRAAPFSVGDPLAAST